jgi:tRNA(Arg) A34 adenosine deaminase TadA
VTYTNDLKKKIQDNGVIFAKHAEENVLEKFCRSKYRHLYRPKQLTLVVIRINRYNIIDSKPCTNCVKIMKAFGLRRVIYSYGDGSLVTESLTTIYTVHSNGYRAKEDVIRQLDEIADYYQHRIKHWQTIKRSKYR